MSKKKHKRRIKRRQAFFAALRRSNLPVYMFGAIAILITLTITGVRVYRNSTLPDPVSVPSAAAAPSPAPTQEPEAAPSPAVPETASAPAASSDLPPALLQVRSTDLDLSITVVGTDGHALTGSEFTLDVQFPDGSTRTVKTDSSAFVSFTGLEKGKYTVSMHQPEGFQAAWPVSCSVVEKEYVSYTPIVNIMQQVEVKEVTEVPLEETKPAEIVSTKPAEAETIRSETVEREAAEVEVPVTDSNGYEMYSYEYPTGENGCLLLASGEESDVSPVVEDGVLSYGLRRVSTCMDAEGNVISPESLAEDAVEGTDYFLEESATHVELIRGDGSPAPEYQITASPITEKVKLKSGWTSINGRTYFCGSDGQPVKGLKNIDGQLYFFNSEGVKASRLGIDVSYFNSAIDWHAVKASGVDFAIVRVAGRTWGSGTLFEDGNSYKKNNGAGMYLQEARAAGLSIGAYFYSNAITPAEAVEEASLAVEILNGMSLDFPIYIDMEYSGEYPYGRADTLTVAERTEIARAFCETVEAAGYRGGIYAGDYFWTAALNYSELSQYSIWYANYPQDYVAPAFTGWNIWQFSQYGTVNGSPGYNDLNIIY
ncbi:MAG: hypothetical protein MJ135_04650 [Oscillospiraceae bacterium]|nr:hypothetical protein [Oscillospiraceae bacterium]